MEQQTNICLSCGCVDPATMVDIGRCKCLEICGECFQWLQSRSYGIAEFGDPDFPRRHIATKEVAH